jgi:hypothetical protein
VEGQIARYLQPSDSSRGQITAHEQILSKEGTDDHDFLDPSLVNMSVLSTNAYNYRWATLPKDVIPLTAASSDYPVCPAIINALKEHIQQGYFCYGPNEGLPQFREAFAAYFSKRLALGVVFCKEHEDKDGVLPFGATPINADQVMATMLQLRQFMHRPRQQSSNPAMRLLLCHQLTFSFQIQSLLWVEWPFDSP